MKRIVRTYFLSENKFKNRKWTFHGITYKQSRYTDFMEGKTIQLLDPYDFPVIAANSYNFPNNLKKIRSYDKDYTDLLEYNFGNQIKSMGKYNSNKEKLFIKQKGICSLCSINIDYDTVLAKDLHIDHIQPLSKKGRKGLLSNMRLVHKECHTLYHISKGCIDF